METLTSEQQKVRDSRLEVMASERAAADPLPGGLVHAFDNGDIEVSGVKVRKAFVGDQVIFKLIDSPIHKMLLEAQKPKELQDPVECDTRDELMLILQFTMPIGDAWKLAKQGMEAFEKRAMEDVGCKMDFIQPKEIIAAIMEQIARAFKMKISYEAAEVQGDAAPKP